EVVFLQEGVGVHACLRFYVCLSALWCWFLCSKVSREAGAWLSDLRRWLSDSCRNWICLRTHHLLLVLRARLASRILCHALRPGRQRRGRGLLPGAAHDGR